MFLDYKNKNLLSEFNIKAKKLMRFYNYMIFRHTYIKYPLVFPIFKES